MGPPLEVLFFSSDLLIFISEKVMSEHNKNTNTESVISMRAMEIITALLFIAIGLVVMVGSLKLGASWGSDGRHYPNLRLT